MRAVDANGHPVSGVTLLIGPATGNGPLRFDEFGFRGFNTLGESEYVYLGPPIPEFLGVTDSNGIATVQGGYFDIPPSSSLEGAQQYHLSEGPISYAEVFFSVVMTQTQPPGNPSVVVEFFEQNHDHYFITLLQNEIDAIEAIPPILASAMRLSRGWSGVWTLESRNAFYCA